MTEPDPHYRFSAADAVPPAPEPAEEERRSALEHLGDVADAVDIADLVVDGIDLIIRILE
jgi:hypothetical protein